MKLLFLHGWQSTPGGLKPTFLKNHGHAVLNPSLPDDDFEAAVRIAQAEYDQHHPDVVVGSSRGGAVALNIDSGDTPLVLLCPAWKRWGTATTVKRGAVILHSPADETIPFADSQELFRSSGLPESLLIAVGTDHRLADSEPLKAMLEAVRLAIPTLCLGIDVTWWGGSTRYRVSQRDTIVHTIFQNGLKSDLQFSTVDLSRAPNPRSDQPTEANFDADARLLAGEVSRILNDNRERFVRCIVALDAPLEAMVRPDQPPRVKAVRKGQTTGAKRRQCECAIQAHQSNANIGHQRVWNADLRIQSGSPVPSRITNLLRELAKENGLVLWGRDRRLHNRNIIEIFPSEAIWSLGLLGAYPSITSQDVRAYKSKKPHSLAIRCAEEQALRPLSGFVRLLERGAVGTLPIQHWIEQIAAHARGVALHRQGDAVTKGKGFDDPIESGIAFLTGVAFALGRFHAWGDGSDGTIVGPGT